MRFAISGCAGRLVPVAPMLDRVCITLPGGASSSEAELQAAAAVKSAFGDGFEVLASPGASGVLEARPPRTESGWTLDTGGIWDRVRALGASAGVLTAEPSFRLPVETRDEDRVEECRRVAGGMVAGSSPRPTEAALCAWIGRAAPGDTLVYHRGALARDTCPQLNLRPPDERVRLAKLAARAWRLADAGLACLVQRRRGFEDYEYLLVARRRPRRIAPSITPLPLRDAA